MSSSCKESSIRRRDFRHSHDDTEYKVPSKKKKKTKPKKGCPANDGNAHVYEWFRVFYKEGYIREAVEKTCIGCDKVSDRKFFMVSDFLKDIEIYDTKYKERMYF